MKRRRESLGVKLTLLVWGISMLITASMSFLFYGRVTESVRDNYRNTVEESLRIRGERFETMMQLSYLSAVYAAEDTSLKRLLQEENSNEEMIELLRAYCRENESIHSIYCYNKAADELVQASTEDAQVLPGSMENRSWMLRVSGKEQTEPFAAVYNLDSTSVIRRNFFSYGKKILDEQGEELGEIFVNVDERQVFFECLQTEGSALGTLNIVQGDTIVSSDRVSLLWTGILEDENSIRVEIPAGETGYSVCSLAEGSVLEQDLITSRNWILLVTGLLNLIFAVPVYLLLKRLLVPVRQLEEEMNQVKEGNLSVRARVYRQDEIGSLSEHFNEMLDQVETLVDELANQKMLKREAELEALSYQITPHFMYNTLSSIRYAAILEGYEEIGGLLQAFIELLRLSASDRGAFITVQQEVRMVDNYIRLQQFRYKDTFEAELTIEPGAENFYVPRLLIQPLVENAILHGLDHMEEGNLIEVDVRRKDELLEIRVTDNGSGMTGEEIQTLLGGGFHSKFSGIGINNILERLRLYYGDRGSLNYLSPEEGGTIAVITLPASEDPEEYVI